MFEYIVIYSFLQSITIFLLYSINVDLSDFQVTNLFSISNFLVVSLC